MAYTKYHDPWADADGATGGGDETTPLVAAALDHIEQGVFDAAATADAAIPKTISGVATDKVPVYNGSAWVAQQITNAQISSSAAIAVSKLSGAWSSYTPTWTGTGSNPAIGNGTLAGGYFQVGKMVLFRVVMSPGSTTTFGSGAWLFSLPVPAAASEVGGIFGIGSDASAGTFSVIGGYSITNAVPLSTAGANVSPTVPFTWASGDALRFRGFYEAA